MTGHSRLVAAVVAAVTIGAAAVALGVALLLGDIVHLRSTATSTLRTGDYLDATLDVERAVVDAETGLRGYVITGERQFLGPTRTAQAQLPQATAALERAASNEGAFVARATALANSARAYMTGYVPRVTKEVATHSAAAQSVSTTALGKSLVDGIRGQTAELERLISARQAARQRSARNSANRAVAVAIVVLIVLTGLTLALGGFLGWLLLGRERARERAAFLADSGALLDRGTTGEEVLDAFAKLALERGNAYCVAEELGGPQLLAPDLETGHVASGDATIVSPGDRPRAEEAWEQARRLAQTRRVTSTHTAVLPSQAGDVHVLALAGMARGSLDARVLLARRGRGWRREEVQVIEALGARLALALQARALQARTEALYRRSDHIARTLQQSLLPEVIPDLPSCELAVRFAPAGEGDLVGGDFYDVYPVGDDHWAVVVGDVCGKGPHAAAVTAMARWTLRSLAGSLRPPAEVLRSLNAAMLRQDLDGRFITVAYALLSVGADEARVTVACAGHPPAIFVSEAGEPARLDAHGDLLGIWPEIQLAQVELRLVAGESLVLYTDGVTDQGPGPQRLPEHALRDLGADPSARALADALRAESERWSPVPRDDVAIVALRYLPAARSGRASRPTERHAAVPAGERA
ncbi:MAG TPA: SpoIIE family protein phosphatase [Solirubrobacteraceae bacterium]|nr:SpoIIE family protein phosphatase [Solirubrobacteraceae bacterium]